MPQGGQDLGLAIRAAWLSYIGGYTQGQIAERLGVSPVKVHRLIATAHQAGLVKVFVEGEPAECIALEDQLMHRFGLTRCMVVPGLDTPDGSIIGVGTAGAQFLSRYLDQNPQAVIGVGHGRTLAALADRMPRLARPEVKIVSMIGSLTRRAATNPFDMVHRLAERTGGEGHFMPVPFVADSIADKAVLMAQKIVRDVVAMARRTELVLVGIGELGAEAHMLRTGTVTQDEYDDLRAAGAVGDLFGQFLDEDGRPVASEINSRTLGIRLEDLRGRDVVAIAGGAAKSDAILAVLRSGIPTGLITDEPAARRIVSRLNPAQGGARKTTAKTEETDTRLGR